jgi:hypothetical protein
VLRATVVLGDAEIVLEDRVRLFERVLQLVALEDEIVAPRLVAAAVLRVDRTPHGPERPFPPLDPDDDPFLDPTIVEAADRPLREPAGCGPPPHRVYDKRVGRFSQLLRNPFSFLFERSSQEDRLAAYVIREHDRGRTLDEILNDRYVLNRTTPHQLQRLLENPDLVRAIGNDTLESVRTTMSSS